MPHQALAHELPDAHLDTKLCLFWLLLAFHCSPRSMGCLLSMSSAGEVGV
jgi:hypothetical protein